MHIPQPILLLLPRNFRDFWPRPDRPTPDPERALMLVCLCPLNLSNWISLGVRAIQRARLG